MRKLLILCVAAMLVAGCSKETVVNTPCNFKLTVDWVKGSRAQFTISPENRNACYVYCVMSYDHPLYNSSDEEIIKFQLDWMHSDYANARYEGTIDGDFVDMFCYKGTRTVKSRLMSPDCDHKLLVFQIDPESLEAIGPLHMAVFHTSPVPEVDIHFTIQCKGNSFCILPSDHSLTWFWEYEASDRITDVYGSPYFFYYEILDMYDEYDFLSGILSQGPERWTLPDDDPSIKEGVPYVMSVSGCSADGEITSLVYYATFVYQGGQIEFVYSDMPLMAEE